MLRDGLRIARAMAEYFVAKEKLAGSANAHLLEKVCHVPASGAGRATERRTHTTRAAKTLPGRRVAFSRSCS